MPISTVIIEDEEHSRERLKKLLAGVPGVSLVGEASDGQSAVTLIGALRPDLALLDIRLPELSGLEVLARLVYRPMVIFVTAYDQYAVRAFEENAIDYLLKPTSEERRAQAIERARARQRQIDDTLLSALRASVERRRYPDRIAVRQGESILMVPVPAVYWIEADTRYVLIRTRDAGYLLDKTLKELEEELDPDRFCRIHRGVLVAQDRVAKIVRLLGGRYAMKMSDPKGTSLAIGRAYLAQVREKFRF